MVSVHSIYTGLGIITHYSGVNFKKIEAIAPKVIKELENREGKVGQFMNWGKLPILQLNRYTELYEMAKRFKSQTNAKYLTVLGIGGSKHPVEHMLSVNGLNIDSKIKFFSDIDSISLKRFMQGLDNDITKSNFMVVSKSGSTFETKDALLRIKQMLADEYAAKGFSKTEAEKKAAKHFLAVTDKNPQKSELRGMSNSQGWLGNLFIHDDVGGRFSAFDDHSLFALAYAGMKPDNMREMLIGAYKLSDVAKSSSLNVNDPLAQAFFWVNAKLNGIKDSVHLYLGEMFEKTSTWHTQMQNESIKNTLKQIAKVPDAMHHSAEAHFNPANKYAFALSSPVDTGMMRENAQGYVEALSKSYKNAGPFFKETLRTSELGLKPEAAGAMTQSRAYSTVYQEIIENTLKDKPMPEVLESVLQPHVEVYKKNFKPLPGEPDVVVAGRSAKYYE